MQNENFDYLRSTEGQTRKIAGFLKEKAIEKGHEVSLFDATQDPPSPNGFDGVIVGASVHAEKYQTAVIHFLKHHVNELKNIRGGFFSVSLTAAGNDEESWNELEQITKRFLDEVAWKPAVVAQFAGALRYTQYDFFKKFILRLISKRTGGATDTSKDHEYTDWKKVEDFLENILKK